MANIDDKSAIVLIYRLQKTGNLRQQSVCLARDSILVDVLHLERSHLKLSSDYQLERSVRAMAKKRDPIPHALNTYEMHFGGGPIKMCLSTGAWQTDRPGDVSNTLLQAL